MNTPKQVFDDVKPWLFLAAGGLFLYKISGAFSAIGGAITAGAEQATAGVREKAAEAADKAKVKTIAPNATPGNIEKYKADAATIAHALGTVKTDSWKLPENYFLEETDTAFGLLKRDYSRLLLYNNKPYDVKTKKAQNAETSTSAKRAISWKVLVPFYKDETGRDLAADLQKSLNKSKYQPTIKWIL